MAKRGPTETTLYVNDIYECLGDSGQGASFNCKEQHYNIYAAGKLVAEVTRDQFNNDTTKYIHSDHLRSATIVTDSVGKVVEQRYYDAFGRTSFDLTNSPVKSGYTGQEHDADLGLINMRGRLYDPFSRRFLTPDPFVMRPLDPQGLNRFSYVQNNPLNFIDPSGFQEEEGASSMGPITVTVGKDGSRTLSGITMIHSSGSGDSKGTAGGSNGTASAPSGTADGRGEHGNSPHGGAGPGGDYQQASTQQPMSVPGGPVGPGQPWASTNNGSPVSTGGSPTAPYHATPAAGAPPRTNGRDVNGTSSNGAPLPYVPQHPKWMGQVVMMSGAMCLSGPAAELFEMLAVADKAADILEDVAPTLEKGKQGKHTPGHPNYISGRSKFTHGDPQGLLDEFAGTGEPANTVPRGQPGFKERVDFGEIIGESNGQPTSKGMIHYSGKGAHIVPANP